MAVRQETLLGKMRGMGLCADYWVTDNFKYHFDDQAEAEMA
jgi:hypothetical protein